VEPFVLVRDSLLTFSFGRVRRTIDSQAILL
jgi:hypothetical protein